MKKKLTLFAFATAIKLVYIPVICSGQLFTGSGIQISNSAQVTVKGDVLTTSGATITNNGTVEISGNWTNNSGNNCFGTSTGTVVLNGGTQIIGGTSETIFNNLTLAGSASKELAANVTVGGAYAIPAGVLALNDKYLLLKGNKLTISNPSTAAITRTTGFVESETVRQQGIHS